MLVRTWGFVPTRPEHPWIQLEARAETGAVLRASGTNYAALMACLARVRSGIKQAGCPWPGKALTLHFHPACRPEDLPHLDVPVALLMLAIQGQLPAEGLSEWASTGSLDLAGNLHLPHEVGLSHIPTPAFLAKAPTPQVVKVFVGPTDWLAKAHAMPQLDCAVHGAKNLPQLMDQWRAWRSASSRQQKPKSLGTTSSPHIEEGHWRNLEGEGKAKKWLSIAAKKRLPVLMSGGPGMGKSSLARACRGLLPTPPPPHSSVPFLSPHPAGGMAGLLGSWRQGQPRPGAWALADGGILFLDEFSEWAKPARESLRHIMETGRLELHRADGAAVWTSQPWIVAATNCCPCGQAAQHCICQPSELRTYRKRLTAPLLERFPVQLDIGNDSSECNKTWAECREWVQQRGEGTQALTWSQDAELAAQNCGQWDTTSRRLKGHLRRLSEGHCEWRDCNGHVLPEDVFQAHEVMWMNRKGWWAPPSGSL